MEKSSAMAGLAMVGVIGYGVVNAGDSYYQLSKQASAPCTREAQVDHKNKSTETLEAACEKLRKQYGFAVVW